MPVGNAVRRHGGADEEQEGSEEGSHEVTTFDASKASEVASGWDFRRVDTPHAFEGMQCRHPRD